MRRERERGGGGGEERERERGGRERERGEERGRLPDDEPTPNQLVVSHPASISAQETGDALIWNISSLPSHKYGFETHHLINILIVQEKIRLAHIAV